MSIKNMNWIDLSIWVREVSEKLRNSYIDNIYGFKGDIVIRLRSSSGERLYLVAMPGSHVFLSTREIFERRDMESMKGFIELMRRFVRDCRISDIRQVPCERILDIEISCGRDSYILTLELIPRGVIILRDLNGVIKTVSKVVKTRDRILRPGLIYKSPPARSVILCEKDREKLLKNFMKGYDIIRGLVVGLGIPPEISEEFLYRENLGRDLDPKKQDLSMIEGIIARAEKFIEEILRNARPCVVYDENNNPIDFYSITPISRDIDCKPRDSFNSILDEYYTKSILREVQEDSEIRKLREILGRLKTSREDLEKSLNSYREYLSFIEKNYLDLEKILECYKTHIKNPSVCPQDLDNMKIEFRNMKIILSLGDLSLEFDPREDLKKFYIDLRKKISQIEKSIKRIDDETKNIEEKLSRRKKEIEMSRDIMSIRSLKKIEWYERYHWYITSEGLIAIGGRDADQNESIVRKYLEEQDLFFHADIQGGSVFILKNPDKGSEKSITEVALLAGCYSRAWTLGYGSIDVYYVRGSQVSKSPPSGEYLAKGSFMIYGERKWIRGVELKLGIGIEIVKEGYPRVFIAPPDIIRDRALAYAIIIPGSENPHEIADKIIRKWIEKYKNYETMIRAIEPKDIISKIPGRSRLIEIS
ncbi:MAG: ribosome rescue protein RqcH [Sulfolobales archaeon]